MTRRRSTVVLLLAALTAVSCSGTGGPEPPALAPTTTTTTASVPLGPAEYLRILSMSHQVNDLRSCVAPVRAQACAEELDGAGKAAESLRKIVTEDPGIPADERDKTIESAATLTKAVNLLREGGCYGMSAPPTPDPNFLRLCDGLAGSAALTWLVLTADIGRGW